jgi:hypothetical protein
VADEVHEGVERARDHKGSHLHEVVEAGEIQMHTAIPGLELAHFCSVGTTNPPEKADPPRCKLVPLFSGPAVRGMRIRNICGVSAAKFSKWRTGRSGTKRWRQEATADRSGRRRRIPSSPLTSRAARRIGIHLRPTQRIRTHLQPTWKKRLFLRTTYGRRRREA